MENYKHREAVCKVPLFRFVMAQLHTEVSPHTAANKACYKQRTLRDSPFVLSGTFLVYSHHNESDQIDNNCIQQEQLPNHKSRSKMERCGGGEGFHPPLEQGVNTD